MSSSDGTEAAARARAREVLGWQEDDVSPAVGVVARLIVEHERALAKQAALVDEWINKEARALALATGHRRERDALAAQLAERTETLATILGRVAEERARLTAALAVARASLAEFEGDGGMRALDDVTSELAATRVELRVTTKDLAAAREALGEAERRLLSRFLAWRGLAEDATPCKACGGGGSRAYGSSATWHGGAGGQTVTNDVCDKCWGSGDAASPWFNLRRLAASTGTATQAGEEKP